MFQSTRRRALLALPVLAATAIVTVPGPAQAHAKPAQPTGGIAKYLGKWNYDQPDRTTMTNIAVIRPGTMEAPQVGDIVFTARDHDTVVGRTDVGCTWTFKAGPAGLHLNPATQTCHNPTSNAWYTISTWTVTVNGDHEKETIKAVSPNPAGNYDWQLDRGARTKAKEYDPRSAARFPGTWRYDAADPATRANIRVTRSTGSDGKPVVTQTPEQGLLTITGEYDNRITARTADGCTWTLLTRGNTAHLDPAVQTCVTSATAVVTLRYWSIASDGRRLATIIAGTDANDGEFYLNAGLSPA